MVSRKRSYNTYIHCCPALEFLVRLPATIASSRKRNVEKLSESLHVMLLWVPRPSDTGAVAVFYRICRPYLVATNITVIRAVGKATPLLANSSLQRAAQWTHFLLKLLTSISLRKRLAVGNNIPLLLLVVQNRRNTFAVYQYSIILHFRIHNYPLVTTATCDEVRSRVDLFVKQLYHPLLMLC